MDAITLLVKDHQTVEKLFEKFEQTGPRAMKARKSLADRIVRELSVHASIEEQVLYPAIREALAEAKKMAPTRPHPKAPDAPPGNIAADTGAALLDRARDAAKKAQTEMPKKAAKATAKKAAGRSRSSR